MEMEIIVPSEVPVMTLPNLTFFPQALLPLHIFETRYREMLRDVLASNRLFAVAGLDPRPTGRFEPPHRIATMGIVRACQATENGTSNLLIQGLARVEIQGIIREEPYRTISIRALTSVPGAELDANTRLRTRLARLLAIKQRLAGNVSDDFTRFLKTVEDPEIFVDLAAFSLCEDPRLKQRLLETLDVHQRLTLLHHHLHADIESTKLRHTLQGNLPDDAIPNN
jgi:Lon protease-like protein